MTTSHFGFLRTELKMTIPAIHVITIPTDAGLSTPPMAADGGRSAPSMTPTTTRITSRPSSTGISDPTR